MAVTRFGTFEELMTDTAESMRPVARRLREVILDLDPGAVEVVRLGDHAATFGVGPRKMIEGYAYVLPQRTWVNLGFFRGASLPDPEGRLDGTGARMRHVKVHTVEDAGAPSLRALLEAARAERRAALATRE